MLVVDTVCGDDETAAQRLTKRGTEFKNGGTEIHKDNRNGDWAHQGRI
jgi:hypothetical protein